jgi:hypothetical protein
MKSKKLKKIIKQSLIESTQVINGTSSIFNDYLFTDVTDEIKSKTRNLIYRILKFRDNLNITINENHIYISSENGFDFVKANSTSNILNNTSDYLSIDIIKDIGYLFHWQDKRFAFKDSNLYKDVLSKVEITFKELNEENFSEIYALALKKSGLSRDSNLDELFPT